MENSTFTDEVVHIVIPVAPVTKKNSSRVLYKYINGKKVPFIAPSVAYKQYERDCGFFLKPLGIDYPVNIKTVFYMGTRRHVDLTNLLEAIHDTMVHCGTITDDNYKIVKSVDGSRVEYDKTNPRTEIWITKYAE